MAQGGTRTAGLRVEITGNSSGGTQSVNEFERSLTGLQNSSDKMAQRVAKDFEALQQQAQKAAQSVNAIADVPTGKLHGLIQDLGRDLDQYISRKMPNLSGMLGGGGSGGGGVVSNLLGGAGGEAEGAAAGLSGISSGAAAAAAGVGALAVGVTALGVKGVKSFQDLASEVRHFSAATGASAEQSSVLIAVGQNLGVSSEAFGNAMGKMSINVEKNKKALEEHGVQIVKNKAGQIDVLATFNNVAKAYAGNTDVTDRNTIANAAFGRAWQQLVPILAAGGKELDDLTKKAKQNAPILNNDDVKNGQALHAAVSQLGQEFKKMEVSLGSAIAPALTVVIHLATELIHPFAQVEEILVHGIAQGLEHLLGWASHLPVVGSAIKDWRNSLEAVTSASKDTSDAQDALKNKIDQTRRVAKDTEHAFLDYASALKAAEQTWNEFNSNVNTAAGVQEKYQQSLDALDQLTLRSAGNQASYGKAVQSAATQVENAQQSVAKAYENVAKAQADAEKVQEDSARRIADVEEQSARRIMDAQKRLDDARRTQAHDAEQGAQRIQDAKQALMDAEVSALGASNQFQARRQIENAQRNLERVQADVAYQSQTAQEHVDTAALDMQRTQEDTAKAIANAQESAADAATQAAQRIKDAQAGAADAARKLVEAQNSAAESVSRAGDSAAKSTPSHKQLADAMQGVADSTYAMAFQMLHSGKPLAEVQKWVDEQRQHVINLGTAWGFPNDELQRYKNEFDNIPTVLNLEFVLHLNATQFKNELATASQQFSGQTQRDVAAGIWDTLPGNPDFVPTLIHDEGGIVPPGMNRIYNGTGLPELTLNPPQIAGLQRVLEGASVGGGGGGDTYHVTIQGSVLTERDLVDMLARLKRNGFNFGGL